MESSDLIAYNSDTASNTSETVTSKQAGDLSPTDYYAGLQEQALANFQKPNVPNVNVPERIIFCLDVCVDKASSMYRLGDGTTFTPINMLKRVLDFFINTKSAINKKTEFALITMQQKEPCWVLNFTNSLKDIFNVIDYISGEESCDEAFNFQKVFELIKQKVEIPDYNKLGDNILPPTYVIRMIVLYGRSNCVPVIPQDDVYFIFLKKQLYFYIDILLAHEEDCALYKCEEIYDALQDLDNGYSYVYEVSRNATKIHDCIAKLLAHPLQRPLQKYTDYRFGTKYV